MGLLSKLFGSKTRRRMVSNAAGSGSAFRLRLHQFSACLCAGGRNSECNHRSQGRRIRRARTSRRWQRRPVLHLRARMPRPFIKAIAPVLQASPLMRGATVTLRFGPRRLGNSETGHQASGVMPDFRKSAAAIGNPGTFHTDPAVALFMRRIRFLPESVRNHTG